MNVMRRIREAAAAAPDAVAVVSPDGRRLTFRQLDARSDRQAHGLVAHGIGKGERTLLLVKAGVDLIAVTYALLKVGAVPVLIDPGMGRDGFLRCVRELEPTAFVGIPAGHVARLLFPGSFKSVKRHVTVGTRWLWGGPTLDGLAAAAPDVPFPLADVAPSDDAAVLFTSGSTGPAKGVEYTHGIFDAQVDALRAAYGFRPGEVDCAAFPLFSLFDNALGMTSVIPDLDPSRPGTCDPAKVVAALRDEGCTTAFGSPAIWKRVAPWCIENGVKLPKVERVVIAGASVPPALVAQLRETIGGDVHTPYGATEALPVASIAGAEILGETAARTRAGAGTCVGRPVDGTEVRILPISDGPLAALPDALPDGEVGEIAVRGRVVTRAYARKPEATAAAKIPDGDAVWHRMGDLGWRDERGRIWFCGRKAERVRTAEGTLFTDQVEGLTNAKGLRTALVGVGEPGAQRPVLVVEGREDPDLAAALRPLANVEAVLFHPAFPVDVRHNAKIHRHQLAKWAAERIS